VSIAYQDRLREEIMFSSSILSRSRWPRGLRRGPAGARLLGLWVQIPPEAWTHVACVFYVLSGRGLCVSWSLVQRSPIEWCVSECDCGTSQRRLRPTKAVELWETNFCLELACLSGPLVIHAHRGFFFTFFDAHLNTIFGASCKEVMGGWKKWHDDRHNIYFS